MQEWRLASRGGNWQDNWQEAYYLPTKGDLFIATFRRWVSKFSRGGHFGEPRPGQLEAYDWWQPELLLYRYAQHTKHCASCSNALQAVRRWRPRLMVAGTAVATLGKALLDLMLPSGAWQPLSCLRGLTSGTDALSGRLHPCDSFSLSKEQAHRLCWPLQ